MRHRFISSLVQSVRSIFRCPGTYVLVVALLIVGLGSTMAMFAILKNVVLDPLEYEKSDELVNVGRGEHLCGIGPADFRDLQSLDSFEEVGVFTFNSLFFEDLGRPGSETVLMVSPEFLPMLRIKPVLGRLFEPTDSRNVILLSHDVWVRRYDGSADVVGKSLRANDQTYQIIGVLPDRHDAYPLKHAEFVIPLNLGGRLDRGGDLFGLARLAEDVSLASARAELDLLTSQINEELPELYWDKPLRAVSLKGYVLGGADRQLWIFQGIIFLVLLISATNGANLLLVRSFSKDHELAIRRALGASRVDILSYWIGQGLVIASAAAIGGLILADWLIHFLPSLAGFQIPRSGEIELDAATILAASVLSFLFASLALLPAILRSIKSARASQLTISIHRATVGRRPRRFQKVLVVTEIALALVLVVSGSLLIRTLDSYRALDLGFQAEGLWIGGISVPGFKYDNEEALRAVWVPLLREIQALPGVESAAISQNYPLRAGGINSTFRLEGDIGEDEHLARQEIASTDYFQTYRIPILEGRGFELTDREGSVPVVVINQKFSKQYFSGRSAVGEKIEVLGEPKQIVGVAGNIYNAGLNSEPFPAFYVPFLQMTRAFICLAIRPEPGISGVVKRVEAKIADVPNTGEIELSPATELFDDLIATVRFQAWLITAFALIGLFLATAGTFAVQSYSVAQRTREMGIRMALGASSVRIVALAAVEGLRILALGIFVGLIAAFGLTRLIQSLLFGVPPIDPLSFAMSLVLLSAVTFVACLVPALHAGRQDPAEIIRYQ